MKRLIIALTFVIAAPVWAAGGGMHLMDAPNDLSDTESLKRGAKTFVDYCLSCHSASFMRFSRMGQDLNLSEDELKSSYMYATDKVGQPMSIAMRGSDAKNWFGVAPPDLSVISRSRGTDWLYTYLLNFYADEKRPFGVNNRLFPDVAMPHVLWELEGGQKAIYKTVKNADGKEHQVVDKLEPADAAKFAEYKKTVTDLVNFLEYMGEPAKLQRKSLGVKVILFLLILLVLAYLLKREYWRDVR